MKYADEMTFGEQIEAISKGHKIKNRPNLELDRAKRKYRNLKKLEGLASDPFWFELDGWKFKNLKLYRGKERVYLWGDSKKEVSIYDMERVKNLGFVRQRKTKSGMVDFHTTDKTTKSDRPWS